MQRFLFSKKSSQLKIQEMWIKKILSDQILSKDNYAFLAVLYNLGASIENDNFVNAIYVPTLSISVENNISNGRENYFGKWLSLNDALMYTNGYKTPTLYLQMPSEVILFTKALIMQYLKNMQINYNSNLIIDQLTPFIQELSTIQQNTSLLVNLFSNNSNFHKFMFASIPWPNNIHLQQEERGGRSYATLISESGNQIGPLITLNDLNCVKVAILNNIVSILEVLFNMQNLPLDTSQDVLNIM